MGQARNGVANGKTISAGMVNLAANVNALAEMTNRPEADGKAGRTMARWPLARWPATRSCSPAGPMWPP